MSRAQNSLEGNPLPNEPTPKKPWRRICSANCWRAGSPPSKCKCKCGGAHHGEGKKASLKEPQDPESSGRPLGEGLESARRKVLEEAC